MANQEYIVSNEECYFVINRTLKYISRSLNLDSGCIGFKCCKRGGGDVPFGHLAPVIQFVTPSPTHAELYSRTWLFYLTWGYRINVHSALLCPEQLSLKR